MSDDVAIDFTTRRREGTGTTFRCTTKVGPFVTRDLMTVTEWVEGTTMGVTRRSRSRTRFVQSAGQPPRDDTEVARRTYLPLAGARAARRLRCQTGPCPTVGGEPRTARPTISGRMLTTDR